MKKKIPFIILLIPGLLITACNKGGNSTSNKEEEYNIVRPIVTPDYETFENSYLFDTEGHEQKKKYIRSAEKTLLMPPFSPPSRSTHTGFSSRSAT